MFVFLLFVPVFVRFLIWMSRLCGDLDVDWRVCSPLQRHAIEQGNLLVLTPIMPGFYNVQPHRCQSYKLIWDASDNRLVRDQKGRKGQNREILPTSNIQYHMLQQC